MSESSWWQLGGIGAFLAVVTYVTQASIRGTWRPAAWTKELLELKDQAIALKDEQIVLLTAERDAWKATSDKQIGQISNLTEANKAFEHFFTEVPVVPSIGDKTPQMEA